MRGHCPMAYNCHRPQPPPLPHLCVAEMVRFTGPSPRHFCCLWTTTTVEGLPHGPSAFPLPLISLPTHPRHPPHTTFSFSPFSSLPLDLHQSLIYDEYGRPFVIIRDQESKTRLKGIDAQKANILAARTVTNILRSSLGPKGEWHAHTCPPQGLAPSLPPPPAPPPHPPLPTPTPPQAWTRC